ncbi:hypothetical protein HanIR_Chr06g0297751 [Helianthus annuus]|nr:hypothetical protein HanIR_Chr06g0297751 [Helianthus annuus]
MAYKPQEVKILSSEDRLQTAKPYSLQSVSKAIYLCVLSPNGPQRVTPYGP